MIWAIMSGTGAGEERQQIQGAHGLRIYRESPSPDRLRADSEELLLHRDGEEKRDPTRSADCAGERERRLRVFH